MLGHGLAELDRASDVVVIVAEWVVNRLVDVLAARKVDYGVVLLGTEQFILVILFPNRQEAA